MIRNADRNFRKLVSSAFFRKEITVNRNKTLESGVQDFGLTETGELGHLLQGLGHFFLEGNGNLDGGAFERVVFFHMGLPYEDSGVRSTRKALPKVSKL